MFDRVSEDIKVAMKAKEKERLDALRMLKSKLLENKTSPKPIGEDDVAISYCKKLKDSLELYPQGSEQAHKINREIEILAAYLPKPLDAAEVKALVTGIVSKLEQPSFSAVMKELSPQIKGKFDGKAATELVKSLLS